MKLKKHGYTLTEVLLALAIVGVIAAILVPNFATNAMKSRSAATLGRAVRQIETGAMAIIQNFNENTMNTAGSVSYTDSLSLVLHEHNLANNSTNGIKDFVHSLGLVTNPNCTPTTTPPTTKPTIYKFNSQEVYNQGDAACYKFTKFQADALIGQIRTTSIGNANIPIAKFYIDTNGFRKRPNQLGKDVFIFTLFDNAKMVPNGAVSNMSDDAVAASHLSTCKKGEVSDGTTCAASVVADGFRITYY